MKVLIAIPTYNEADNIVQLTTAIWQQDQSVHILVIDDGSPDGTADLVKKMQKNQSQEKLFILERPNKMGLGSAYIQAFKWGLARGYDAIIEMDADFSHDPKTIPTMVSNLTKFPVIVGSRYIKDGGTVNWNICRQLISKFGSFYSRLILGLDIGDFTGGFNGWHRMVLEKLSLDQILSEGYTFQIELKYRAAKLGFPIKEIPIVFHERRAGKSKMSANIVLEAMIKVWKLRLLKL